MSKLDKFISLIRENRNWFFAIAALIIIMVTNPDIGEVGINIGEQVKTYIMWVAIVLGSVVVLALLVVLIPTNELVHQFGADSEKKKRVLWPWFLAAASIVLFLIVIDSDLAIANNVREYFITRRLRFISLIGFGGLVFAAFLATQGKGGNATKSILALFGITAVLLVVFSSLLGEKNAALVGAQWRTNSHNFMMGNSNSGDGSGNGNGVNLAPKPTPPPQSSRKFATWSGYPSGTVPIGVWSDEMKVPERMKIKFTIIVPSFYRAQYRHGNGDWIEYHEGNHVKLTAIRFMVLKEGVPTPFYEPL